MQRLESLIMPANCSSIVGEFMHGGIAKYCEGLIKNRYPNRPLTSFPQVYSLMTLYNILKQALRLKPRAIDRAGRVTIQRPFG